MAWAGETVAEWADSTTVWRDNGRRTRAIRPRCIQYIISCTTITLDVMLFPSGLPASLTDQWRTNRMMNTNKTIGYTSESVIVQRVIPKRDADKIGRPSFGQRAR
jgi:hypothetical protein